MVALQTVEIPGFREAVKKERTLRDAAFLDGNEILLGEEVVPLSLRRMIWLEQGHNGFVCPWRWESDDELVSHALALVYFMRPAFRAPSVRFSFLREWRAGIDRHRLSMRILRRHTPEEIVRAVDDWVAESFMDAPSGDSSNVSGVSHASWPAYIFDLFGSAGLTYSAEEILDLPLKRLFQHCRVAMARIHDAKLTNPSDEIAVRHIAGIKP